MKDARELKELLNVYKPMPDQVDGMLDLWDAFVDGV